MIGTMEIIIIIAAAIFLFGGKKIIDRINASRQKNTITEPIPQEKKTTKKKTTAKKTKKVTKKTKKK